MKKSTPLFAPLVWLLSMAFSPAIFPAPAAASPGDTTVLKWKDGKKAVFLLMFDDSIPTDIKTVVPELTRRGMVATFYVNCGGQAFKAYRRQWETEVPKTGMVYANHTFTHRGVKNAEELDAELAPNNAEIDACFPDAKKPRLISFGQPGGVPWLVTKEEFNAALAKYHLIDRPPFKGFPINIKTQPELLALVDHALATGGMEYNVSHGVGGDWLVTPVEVFTALLDKLEANKDQLWITDAISWRQYATERQGAAVKTLEASPGRVRVSLTCPADPAFYDLPLTLTTQVPPGWQECVVMQGTSQTRVTATHGSVQYAAVPGAAEITIQPATRN